MNFSKLPAVGPVIGTFSASARQAKRKRVGAPATSVWVDQRHHHLESASQGGGATGDAARGELAERGAGVAVSFVVIAYNERAVIGDCLRSLQAQHGLDLYEIVVVDDGSTDGTGDLVRQLAASDSALQLISHETNRGRGAARTTGVKASRGRLVAMVDSDVLLPSEWWQTCLAALKDHDVAVGTAVPDGDVTYLARRYSLAPKVVAHSALVTGSNSLFRREVFDRIGYEENLRDGEDVALSYEIERSGLRSVSVPGLVVEHREQRGLASSLAWLYQSGVGASRQLERYRRLRKPDVAFFVFLASAALALTLKRFSKRSRLLRLLGVQLAISVLHVGGKFAFRKRELGRFALAAVTDAALLGAYFSGRIAGHAWLRISSAREIGHRDTRSSENSPVRAPTSRARTK